MDIKPFASMYLSFKCIKCKKPIGINTVEKEAMSIGCSCPFCYKLHSVDEMLLEILKFHINKKE